MSARTIPGNEDAINRLRQRFAARDIHWLDPGATDAAIHASGHPCAGELRQMYELLRPRVAVPVHGEARHMAANARIARDAGVPLALTGKNGDLFYLAPEPAVRRRARSSGRLRRAFPPPRESMRSSTPPTFLIASHWIWSSSTRCR